MTGCIAIIPAKGTSSRIPRKNEKLFHGKPILYYSIKAAQESGLFGSIAVSTEDERIGLIAEGYGARWCKRDVALTADRFGPHDVARELLQSEWEWDERWAHVCVLYATAPLMSVDDLKRGFSALGGMNYAVSVTEDPAPLADAAQFIWAESGALLSALPLWSHHTALVPIAGNRVCDINTLDDWSRAEAMYAALHA